jgi:hypothetical protein
MVIVRLDTFWSGANGVTGLALAGTTPEDNTFIRTILNGILPVQ